MPYSVTPSITRDNLPLFSALKPKTNFGRGKSLYSVYIYVTSVLEYGYSTAAENSPVSGAQL